MKPLMPSPGSPKTVSTPHSVSRSTNRSAAVSAMAGRLLSALSCDGRSPRSGPDRSLFVRDRTVFGGGRREADGPVPRDGSGGSAESIRPSRAPKEGRSMSTATSTSIRTDEPITVRPRVPLAARLADPVPVGLAGFGLTTFMLSLIEAGIVDKSAMPVVLGSALAYGGLLPLLAGRWAFLGNKTLSPRALGSFGG